MERGTYPEMEKAAEAKLALIAERAGRERGCVFTSLAHLMNEGFLAVSYRSLGRNKAAGVDNVSWAEYGKELEKNLEGLVDRLKGKRYWPQPARRVYIPKDEHTKRPLGIPALEDKIVQKAVSRILEAIYEKDFREASHGFRPERGCHTALKAVDRLLMSKPINHIYEADIKGFFDNVAHDRMMEFLGRRIADSSLLRVIGRFLKAGYMESGLLVASEKGTPQGGNLSPMLANIFLHNVLDEWFEKEVKPQMQGESHLVRYADDFAVMVQFKGEAAWLAEQMRERFRKYGLELHPGKTRVISFGRYEAINARKQKRKANTFEFLGLTHYCGKSRKGNHVVGHRTAGKRFRKKLKEVNLWLKTSRNVAPIKDLWQVAAAKLRGHYQYYGISGNYQAIRRFYDGVIRLMFKWLNRRCQRKSFGWEGFRTYLERYPLPKPRIVHRLYDLAPVR